MTKSKLRSPKLTTKSNVPTSRRSWGKSAGKAKPCKLATPKGRLRSLRSPDVKKHPRRSLMRTALPTTAMRSKKEKRQGRAPLAFNPRRSLMRAALPTTAMKSKKEKRQGGAPLAFNSRRSLMRAALPTTAMRSKKEKRQGRAPLAFNRRRSLMRAALPTTAMRSKKEKRQGRAPLAFKPNAGVLKPKGVSRRIKLIDASPGKRSKKRGGGGGGGGGVGTPVLFLTKDYSNQSDKKVMKSASHSRSKNFGWRPVRKDPRYVTMPKSRAHEGVDFFYNLGQRVLHPKSAEMPARLRGGGGGLAGGIVGTRLATGRLETGGPGAGVSGINGRLTDGPKLGGRSFGLGKFPRGAELKGTGMTRSMGGTSLRPNPVLYGSPTMMAKDVVVPLTNRLPIIDFISTSEFHNMYAAQKLTRRFER